MVIICTTNINDNKNEQPKTNNTQEKQIITNRS